MQGGGEQSGDGEKGDCDRGQPDRPVPRRVPPARWWGFAELSVVGVESLIIMKPSARHELGKLSGVRSHPSHCRLLDRWSVLAAGHPEGGKTAQGERRHH